jgi:hypothetical protein
MRLADAFAAGALPGARVLLAAVLAASFFTCALDGNAACTPFWRHWSV